MVLYQFVEQIYIHFRQTKWSIGFGVWRKNYGYLLWYLNSQVITKPEHDSRLYCIDHMGSNGPSFSWVWSKIVSKLFLTSTYCFFRPLFSFLPFFPFLPFPLAFFCFLSFPRCRRGFLLSVVLKSTISRRKLVKTVTLRCKYTGIVFLTCIRWRRRKVAVAWFHCLFRHWGNSCCCCCCAWNICWCRALLFDFLYHDDLLFKFAHLFGDRVAHFCGDIVALCDCFWWTLLLLHLCALLPCNVFTHLFVRES